MIYTIATLITCHNRKEKTLQCLNSLFNCELPEGYSLDIFLVDDGSSDSTTEAIKTSFREVNIIQGNGNLYWNRGMHLAWKTAAKVKDYDFYLWLNDDTFLKANAIETIFNNYKTVNNHSIICGVCHSQKSLNLTFGGYDKYTYKRIIPTGKPEICHYFNGNIVLVPKSVYKLVGNLDPVFHHSIGDFDYGLRALKKGITSYITSEIIAYCEHNDLPRWCNPNFKLRERISIFYRPLGAEPFLHFRFAKRHYNFYKAIRNLLTNHLRLFFPHKWQNK
ncbi:MAG: glycosyltransferase family 2 protein [Prolixibacteraceae bacterium]|nr:glycosyltransferase family 2 protein [Prolixibacteraceae bacterium]